MVSLTDPDDENDNDSDEDDEDEDNPALSSSTTTNKCNNMLSLQKNNIVITKMMATGTA